jgi:hypothetical protein
MSVDLASTLKKFVGDKTLTTDLLLEAASHLVNSLKDLSLTDMEKNQLVFTALLAHVTPSTVSSCLPLLKASCLPSLPFSWFKKSAADASNQAVSPAPAPAAPSLTALPAPAEALAVRVPESN